MKNFIIRTISGIGFGAVMLAALLTNKYVFGVVMLLSLIVMMREFLKMTCFFGVTILLIHIPFLQRISRAIPSNFR